MCPGSGANRWRLPRGPGRSAENRAWYARAGRSCAGTGSSRTPPGAGPGRPGRRRARRTAGRARPARHTGSGPRSLPTGRMSMCSEPIPRLGGRGSPVRRARSPAPSGGCRAPRAAGAGAGWCPRRSAALRRRPGPRARRAAAAASAAGICTPGTLAARCSSARIERTGPTPARIAQRWSRPRSRTSLSHRANRGTSNTYWVCTNSAPAATFVASRAAGAERVRHRADQPVRRGGQGPAGQQPAVVAHAAGGLHQLHAVQVEHRPGLRVVAGPRVVAGHQQHVPDAQRGRAEQVGLAARSGCGPGR